MTISRHPSPARTTRPLKPVALDIAAPDAAEGLLELGPDVAEIDGPAVAGLQPEIVDHDQAAVVEVDRERNLVDDLEAHMLEHGQGVGQRNRAVRVIELEADLMLAGLQRAAQAHADLLAGGQGLLDHVDVAKRGFGVEAFAVAGPEGPLVAPEMGQPALLAMGRDQCILQLVGPGPGGLDDLGLDGVGIKVRNRARPRADEHVGASQRRIAELGVPVAAFALEGLLHDRLHTAPEIGVIAVARDVDEAGHEALEIVAAQEQGDPLAFLQVEDPEAGVEQVVLGNLEQLVAREVLENIGQGLAVVAVGRQAGAFQDPLYLAPQQRNLAGRVVVRRGGEQADEKVLADTLPLAPNRRRAIESI